MRKFFGVGVRGPLAALAAFSSLAVEPAMAGISYTTIGSLYQEEFNGLPVLDPGGGAIPTSNSLEGAADFPDGWQDDVDWATSPQVDLSVLGWHLYHPTDVGEAGAGEGGFNGNQRFRMATGNSNQGSFAGFANGNSATPEKALGILNSATLTPNGDQAFIGLKLINNTGQALNRFTLTFDGEQWRDGLASESLTFAYSTFADTGSWATSALYTPVAALDFTAPVTGNNDLAVDGNAVAGRVADISSTVTDFTWAPGAELWLRWADIQTASASDDALSLDSVRFTADAGGVFGSNDIISVQTGLASTPSTWSNNQAPSSANVYRVSSGHTVTIDGDFAGPQLRVKSGGTLNFNATGSGANVPAVVVESGGNISETVSGNYQLGYLLDFNTPLNTLELQGNASLSVGAGETLILGMAVTGSGNLDLNTGAGAKVRMTDSETHTGVIRFNGAGDEVSLEWNRDHGVIEMNSTGDNRFNYLHTGQIDTGTLVYNQPGSVVHSTTVTTPSSRLVSADKLIANAAVTVDLSVPLITGNPNSERRLAFLDGLEGSADITIVGMASDPSNVNTGVGLHEFEVGSSGEPTNIAVDTYSGTITMGGYVNAELRHSMPAADVVVNANARFEMGHDVSATTKEVAFGQVTVNSGGILEIGHEDNLASTTGHVAGKLRLTTSGGQSGDLVLNSGSKTVMGITGTAPSRFDAVFAEGDITLGGVLELWLNPETTADPDAMTTYTPVLNDEFVIMSLVGGTSPAADFDSSGTVDAGDLAEWKTTFGVANNGADADGDGDSDGADILAWQQTLGEVGSSSGTITGNFTDVVAPTEAGAAWPAGLDFETVVVGNEVILRVISIPAIAAIPEPASIAMVFVGGLGLIAARRQRTAAG